MLAEVPSASDPREEVVTRAVNDIVFRQQLLADPKPTLERALGISLPPTLEVKVLEEAPNRICLVLPMLATAGQELTDEELAAAAGGIDPIPMPRPADMPEAVPTRLLTFSSLYLQRRRR